MECVISAGHPPNTFQAPTVYPPLFPDDAGQTKITSKILGLNANKVVEKISI